MKILTALIISAFIIGCSSEKPEDDKTTFEKNECVTAGAAYQASYTEVNGNCGDLPDAVLVVDESGVLEVDAECDNIPRYDGCSVFLDMTCVTNEFILTETGKVDWAEDGSSGNGTLSISIEDTETGASCTSTYKMSAVRL